MGGLPRGQLSYDSSTSSVRCDLRQAALCAQGYNDVAVVTPTTTPACRRIAQRLRLAAIDTGFPQLPSRKEPNPLPVRRKERCTRCIRAQ